MPSSVSAFAAFDGSLFMERKDAESHELLLLLKDKFGEKEALKLQVIVEEREWFESAFARVKRSQLAGAESPHLREVGT